MAAAENIQIFAEYEQAVAPLAGDFVQHAKRSYVAPMMQALCQKLACF